MIGLTYLIFFISGVSGLIYQVIWVREFGQIFGNTVQSASLVTGTFILGLGVGSYLAGKIIDVRNRIDPQSGLAYYAYSELLIAVLGLLISLLTPRLEALSPAISSYVQGDQGWYELTTMSYLLRYVIAMLLVGPITMLMGATLTFLIRFVLSQSVDQAGWKIGLLYGMNTLGAALGCALVDLWAVPAIGLMQTKMIAVGFNALAGLAALYLVRTLPLPAIAKEPERAAEKEPAVKRSTPKAKGKGKSVQTEPPPVPAVEVARERLTLTQASLAIAISGFCALGMEIVWFRFMSSVYSASRYVFSLLLVTILVGMWLGSFLAGYLSKRVKRQETLYLHSQILFAVFLLLCLFAFFESDRRFVIDLFRDTFFGARAAAQASFSFKLFDAAVILAPALVTLFVPAVFMGFAFPAMNGAMQNDTERVGSSAGTIYLWNCAGAVLGALVTGFLLLPMIGMQNCVTVLAIGSVLAIIPVLPGWNRERRRPDVMRLPLAVKAGTALFVVLVAVWIARPADYLVKNSLFTDYKSMLNLNWLKISEGINEVAMVAEGQQGQGAQKATWRRLYTNGHPMSGTDYLSVRYMSAFVHIPLLQMDRPESVLVICFGVGNTLHSASLYPTVSTLEVVDLSKNVLGLGSYFNRWNKDVLKDGRTRVFVNDGRQHLRMQPAERYDLVTLEPPPLAHAGVASLYTEEFYRLAHRTLKKGGYMSQWLPVYQVAEEHNRRLIRAFMDVFPNAVLLNGADKEFILLGQKDGPNQIDWKAFQQRLASNDKVRSELKDVDLTDPVELLGMFSASANWLSRTLRDTRPMTDDDPIIENNHFLRYKYVPREIFNTSRLAEWCPSCFVDGKLAGELRPLSYYLRVMQDIYGNADFLKDGPFLPEKKTYKLKFASADNGDAVPNATQPLLAPTQAQFKGLLNRYFYLTTFGPQWAFEYQP